MDLGSANRCVHARIDGARFQAAAASPGHREENDDCETFEHELKTIEPTKISHDHSGISG
jgi:hypothetical protein